MNASTGSLAGAAGSRPAGRAVAPWGGVWPRRGAPARRRAARARWGAGGGVGVIVTRGGPRDGREGGARPVGPEGKGRAGGLRGGRGWGGGVHVGGVCGGRRVIWKVGWSAAAGRARNVRATV